MLFNEVYMMLIPQTNLGSESEFGRVGEILIDREVPLAPRLFPINMSAQGIFCTRKRDG